MMKLRRTAGVLGLCCLLGVAACAREPVRPAAIQAVEAHGVAGIGEEQLTPGFWIRQLADADADAVIMERGLIEAQNARLLSLDASMHDLRALPAELDRATVQAWISDLSSRPEKPLYDVDGKSVGSDVLDGLISALDIAAVPDTQATRFGIVVRRASLRSFPTALRVFSSQGDTDIDRFQESSLFPGTPVAIVHRSLDGQWLFVVSGNYAAWIEAGGVAEGTRQRVLGYADSTGYRVVTGATIQTVHTREEPRVSELQLDMGTRLPLAALPADQPVNGQHPYTSWAIQLPVRNADGSLDFAPALVQKIADTRPDFLPLTRANIISQAFKFLGERYGWGHSYNGRDCSGFVSEVYRSMGVDLPRNTSAQGVSPALNRIGFTVADNRASRHDAVKRLEIGDLIYIPGHVMMMIGRIDGHPYVIHDTSGGSFLRADGTLASMHLNAVSVTPLEPLQFNANDSYIDRITNIIRIRP